MDVSAFGSSWVWDDSVLRSCVRESSSQPHTPKGTAARLLIPGPARAARGSREHARADARNATVAAPYRRFAQGSPARPAQDLPRVRATPPPDPYPGVKDPRSGSDRAVE